MLYAAVIHPSLAHLDKKDNYVKMLFVDFSAAFNTFIPQQLITKMCLLGLTTPPVTGYWTFWLEDPSRSVSATPPSAASHWTLTVPQGYVLIVLLFTLQTHDCSTKYQISNNYKSAHKEEVIQLTEWCRNNNPFPNVNKTKKMIVPEWTTHHCTAREILWGVKRSTFLIVYITGDFSWTLNMTFIAKKVWQHLHFLHRLKRSNLSLPFLQPSIETIKSVLTSCPIMLYGNCTVSDPKDIWGLSTHQLTPHTRTTAFHFPLLDTGL